MKKYFIIAIILSSGVFLNSCYYDKYDELTAASRLTTACDSTNVSYSKSVTAVLSSYCNSCHSSSLSSGGYNFETYDGVMKAVNNNRMIGSIEHTSGYKAMPQGMSTKLSECKLKIIENWISSGAKNN